MFNICSFVYTSTLNYTLYKREWNVICRSHSLQFEHFSNFPENQILNLELQFSEQGLSFIHSSSVGKAFRQHSPANNHHDIHPICQLTGIFPPENKPFGACSLLKFLCTVFGQIYHFPYLSLSYRITYRDMGRKSMLPFALENNRFTTGVRDVWQPEHA